MRNLWRKYDWRKPNTLLVVQNGESFEQAKVFKAHAVPQGMYRSLLQQQQGQRSTCRCCGCGCGELPPLPHLLQCLLTLLPLTLRLLLQLPPLQHVLSLPQLLLRSLLLPLWVQVVDSAHMSSSSDAIIDAAAVPPDEYCDSMSDSLLLLAPLVLLTLFAPLLR